MPSSLVFVSQPPALPLLKQAFSMSPEMTGRAQESLTLVSKEQSMFCCCLQRKRVYVQLKFEEFRVGHCWFYAGFE